VPTIEFVPVTATIGAEVRGVDLRVPPDDDTVATIRQGLLDHLVLFFRDQAIDDDQHLQFALRFGPLSIPPLQTKYQDSPAVTVLDQVYPRGEGADEWHSDNTFMAHPPLGSMLRAAQLPAVGGDTCFASMYAAYDALSEPIRTMLDPLRAVHDITKPMVKAIQYGHTNLDLAEIQKQWPPVEHPVVLTHPETGRKALFVNRNSTTRIIGLSERENELLLPFLFDWVRSPEFQCRLHWEPNTVAFWDNRSVQHYAVADYKERRVMRRVTIDPPVAAS
jgi:taurine dioxygenase